MLELKTTDLKKDQIVFHGGIEFSSRHSVKDTIPIKRFRITKIVKVVGKPDSIQSVELTEMADYHVKRVGVVRVINNYDHFKGIFTETEEEAKEIWNNTITEHSKILEQELEKKLKDLVGWRLK